MSPNKSWSRDRFSPLFVYYKCCTWIRYIFRTSMIFFNEIFRLASSMGLTWVLRNVMGGGKVPRTNYKILCFILIIVILKTQGQGNCGEGGEAPWTSVLHFKFFFILPRGRIIFIMENAIFVIKIEIRFIFVVFFKLIISLFF